MRRRGWLYTGQWGGDKRKMRQNHILCALDVRCASPLGGRVRSICLFDGQESIVIAIRKRQRMRFHAFEVFLSDPIAPRDSVPSTAQLPTDRALQERRKRWRELRSLLFRHPSYRLYTLSDYFYRLKSSPLQKAGERASSPKLRAGE